MGNGDQRNPLGQTKVHVHVKPCGVFFLLFVVVSVFVPISPNDRGLISEGKGAVILWRVNQKRKMRAAPSTKQKGRCALCASVPPPLLNLHLTEK